MALVRRVREGDRTVLRDENGKPQWKIKHKKKRTKCGTRWDMVAVRVDAKSQSQ